MCSASANRDKCRALSSGLPDGKGTTTGDCGTPEQCRQVCQSNPTKCPTFPGGAGTGSTVPPQTGGPGVTTPVSSPKDDGAELKQINDALTTPNSSEMQTQINSL